MQLTFPTVRDVGNDTRRVLARFPYVVLCAVVGTAACIVSVEAEGATVTNVILAAALGLPLLFALRVARERARPGALRGPGLEFAGLAALAGYAATVPPGYDYHPAVIAIRFGLLCLGLHFVAAFVPCLSGATEAEFWEYNRRLFQRFALSVLYTVVLFMGLTLALACANALFDLHVDGKRYGELWLVMTGIFHTLFFLGGAVAQPGEGPPAAAYPAWLRAFAQFALAPLVLVFVFILYIYAGKIILIRTWPHGWVALPVCALASVGILASLLLQPTRTLPTERWGQWYWRYFYRALGPLSLLLLLSVRERVMQYGLTEPRYFGLVIGTWVLGLSAYFVLRPLASTRVIPASLAAICFVTAVGPWGVFAVSRRSQVGRLAVILAPYGAFRDGRLEPGRPLSAADRETVGSIVSRLIAVHGVEGLPELFADYRRSPAATKAPAAGPGHGSYNAYQEREQILTFLGSAAATPPPRESEFSDVAVSMDTAHGLPVAGFRAYFRVCACWGGKPADAGDLRIDPPRKGKPLQFFYHGQLLDSSGVDRLLARLRKLGNQKKHVLPPADLTATVGTADREWTIVVEDFTGQPLSYAAPRTDTLELAVLEK
jgi:hypothetical protein